MERIRQILSIVIFYAALIDLFSGLGVAVGLKNKKMRSEVMRRIVYFVAGILCILLYPIRI